LIKYQKYHDIFDIFDNVMIFSKLFIVVLEIAFAINSTLSNCVCT